jgi:DHA1 family bicyclomycin/chloramphenicol resistance-like MFS transporter
VLENVHGLTKQEFSYAFGTNALGIMVFGQIGGRLVGRVTPARLLGSGLAMSLGGSTILLTATALFGGDLPGTLVGLFLMVSSIGVIMPQVTSLALSGYAPGVAGAASAMIGTAQFLFGAIFAPLTGLGSKTSGLPMALVIFALSGAAVVMRVLLVRTPPVAAAEPVAEAEAEPAPA